MVDAAVPYLTVDEAAERLRVTPQTVYRWCRSGRLAATKIGKAWRIPADQLGRRAQLAGLRSLDTLLTGLNGQSEHLLVLASDNLALARMEATFFDVAAANGDRLVYGRWNEEAAIVRLRLRPALSRVGKGEDALHLPDLRSEYEKKGTEGPTRRLLREIERAGADGARCHIYSSPYAYFAHNFDRCIEVERGVEQQTRGQAALVLCGYALNDLFSLHGTRVLTLFMELAACHTGVICFDGQQALLVRLSG